MAFFVNASSPMGAIGHSIDGATEAVEKALELAGKGYTVKVLDNSDGVTYGLSDLPALVVKYGVNRGEA